MLCRTTFPVVNVSILARPEGRALQAWAEKIANRRAVSILARPEGRALQSAYNVMTFNGEKRTLRELSVCVQQKVRTIKQRS